MDKVFLKRLFELNKAWREQSTNNITVEDLLLNEIDKKDLQKWFDERVSGQYHDVVKNKNADTFLIEKFDNNKKLTLDEKIHTIRNR